MRPPAWTRAGRLLSGGNEFPTRSLDRLPPPARHRRWLGAELAADEAVVAAMARPSAEWRAPLLFRLQPAARYPAAALRGMPRCLPIRSVRALRLHCER